MSRWAPPLGPRVEAVQAGESWDAVRVSKPVAEAVLGALGHRSGAVISDLHGRSLYWLLPPSHDAGPWQQIPQVQYLTSSDRELVYVGVPPAGLVRGPGVHWRLPGGARPYLTDPRALGEALRTAVTATSGPAGVPES